MVDWDDELLDHVFAQLRALANAHEAVAFGAMEVTLEATSDAPSAEANRPPMPGDWHPYYEQHRRWLTHWLNNETSATVLIAITRPSRFTWPGEPLGPPSLGPSRRTQLRRQRAWGLAPYVGDPFVYVWWTASDDRGRWIAGDATTIQHV